LLPSLRADIPALHDAPESKIWSINQTKRLQNGGKKLEYGLDCIIHMIPAYKKFLMKYMGKNTLTQRYILLFSSSNIRS
jgi:hypothetical protein